MRGVPVKQASLLLLVALTLASCSQTLDPARVHDVKTLGWGLRHYVADPETFIVLYGVRARIIRLDTELILCARGPHLHHLR